MINGQTTRVAGLANRVPAEVLLVEIIGAAIALSLLGLHVGVLGRGTNRNTAKPVATVQLARAGSLTGLAGQRQNSPRLVLGTGQQALASVGG